jgi:hypothetical protein
VTKKLDRLDEGAMTAAPITINDAALFADPSGALLWPARRMVVVADLHFEKGSSYAARGQLLPPYDTRATLGRLAQVLRRYRPRRVLCLGDSFHDRGAVARLAGVDAERLARLVAAHEWLWISGNHDPEPPTGLGGRVEREIAIDGLSFRHRPLAAAAARGEVCGHLHPKAWVTTRARRVSGACFVTDGTRLVMPAFGAYAGGLDVLDPAIAGLFGRRGFRVLLTGRERVYMFPHRALDAGLAPAPR